MGNNDTLTMGRRGVTATPFEVIVRMDGSATAAAALDWAAEQSRETGAPLRIVYTWQRNHASEDTAAASWWEASAADARARATSWVLGMLGTGAATVRWTLQIVEGRPEPAPLAPPNGAALLVSGMRGTVAA